METSGGGRDGMRPTGGRSVTGWPLQDAAVRFAIHVPVGARPGQSGLDRRSLGVWLIAVCGAWLGIFPCWLGPDNRASRIRAGSAACWSLEEAGPGERAGSGHPGVEVV